MTNNIFNSDGKLDLHKAVKFHYCPTDGALTIIRTSSGDRTRLSPGLLKALDVPSEVEFYFTEDAVIVVPVTEGGLKIGKGGIVYNSTLAAQIMKIAGGDYPENKSTAIGTFKIESVDDDVKGAVISFRNTTTTEVSSHAD